MSRGRKLFIVGLVLVLGFSLAWPFRKTTTDTTSESVVRSPARGFQQSAVSSPALGSPAPHVVAKMTSLGEDKGSRQSVSSRASFDLANHPALATPHAPKQVSPVTPTAVPTAVPTVPSLPAGDFSGPDQDQESPNSSRPTYATIDRDQRFDPREQRAADVRHVVQNSDTLEKLAKRYLGDENRALDIFDLNRDVLDNPHLLPINAELRIPDDSQHTFD